VKTLLVGVGNPGRRDDGLGPALIERLAGSRPPERAITDLAPSLFSAEGRGTVEAFWTYQLNIEDAATIGEYDRVIFADAAVEETETGEATRESSDDPELNSGKRSSPTLPPGAVLESLSPAASIAFTTHEMSPASVLALAEELYGRAPAGFLLQIRGAEWDFVEGLSPEGERSLAEAERILGEYLKNF